MKYVSGETVQLISGTIVEINSPCLRNGIQSYFVSNKYNYEFIVSESYIKRKINNLLKVENRFYMVYGDNKNQPKIKHPTLQSAINEAERLAKTNPGIIFYILQSFGEFKGIASVNVGRIMY